MKMSRNENNRGGRWRDETVGWWLCCNNSAD